MSLILCLLGFHDIRPIRSGSALVVCARRTCNYHSWGNVR